MRIQQVVYVRIQFKGPQAPHSTFFETFDFHSRWRLSVTILSARGLSLGPEPQRSATRSIPRAWVLLGPEPRRRAHNVGFGDEPGRLAIPGVSQSSLQIFGSF